MGVRGNVNIMALCAILVAPCPGCGPQGGAMLYWLGVGRGRKIEPEFTLPPGKVLVLVDDGEELVQRIDVRHELARRVGTELLRHEAAEMIVDSSALDAIRKTDPNFEQRSVSYLGKKAGADVVLWLGVRDFFAPKEPQDISVAAKVTVSVKVLDTSVGVKPDNVRLWPTGVRMHLETVVLSANQINKLKSSANPVTKALAGKLAVRVARLFYQHTEGDLEEDR